MKKLLFILLMVPAFCLAQTAVKKDAVAVLNARIELLTDSIQRLNQRPVMTTNQFLRLYKYDRLFKYYRICVARPANWKYYKGWSTRVFNQ